MLQVSSKYWDGTKYRVSLQDSEPDLNIISVRLSENCDHLSDSDLIDVVMEQFYRERFEGRFNREALSLVETKAKELDSKVTALDATLENVNHTLTNLENIEKRVNSVIKSVELPQEIKDELVNSYPTVAVGDTVTENHVYNINGQLMKAIKTTSIDAENWIGDASLFVPFLQPTVTIDGEEVTVVSDFVQPSGAHDAYGIGDKVLFDGKVYESIADNNVYSPADYAENWKLVE